MNSVIDDFSPELAAGDQLAILPISRFILDDKLCLGPFRFYPAGSIDLDEFRIVPCSEVISVFERTGEVAVTRLRELHLREALTYFTGITPSILAEQSLVVFRTRLDWAQFLQSDHKDDIRLIRRLTEQAESAMDVIRFHYCHFDIPDTLPGRVGTWNNSGPYGCAVLYTPEDQESYLIAGASITSSVVAGLGLELNSSQCEIALNYPNGNGVASVLRQGLSLFSEVLESNSDTNKFIRAMILIEYLAYPGQMNKMKDVKKVIAWHSSNNKVEYSRICNQFKYFTSYNDPATGQQVGIRTRIIHHGEYLEDIVSDDRARAELFRELQLYIYRVIDDMISRSRLTWDDFVKFREELRLRIGFV